MKDAKDVIPWKVTDISIRPYEGYWSMNPSIHFDGQLWRCVLRCCDYSMPDGVTVRKRSVGQQTKNAMVIFDPKTWRPVQVFKMHERDSLPREACPHMGYEDMRIFRTDKNGLQGIAASLHLRRDREQRAAEGAPQHQPPEQVLLSFDDDYDIVDARPIRGDGWSGTPQKNWVPFDHCAEPRFLYSIDKGRMFDDRGALRREDARVTPSIYAAPVPADTTFRAGPNTESNEDRIGRAELLPQPQETAQETGQETKGDRDAPRRSKKPDRRIPVRGGDVRAVRGGRIKLDTVTSRPSARPAKPGARPAARPAARSGDDSTRVMGTGRMLLPTYEGLRGGTQLLRVADDAWLGIGHEMKFVSGKKWYWHTFYLVDALGKMRAASEPVKLAPNGIEFAAGMAIDGDRVVVSFGVDDMECCLGETSLSAVMEMLRPLER